MVAAKDYKEGDKMLQEMKEREKEKMKSIHVL